MKTVVVVVLLLGSPGFSWAATTINPTNKFAYGANLGWLDWRGDTNTGAVVGEFVCSGYIYSANVGWINLGGGAPTNGIQYQNLSPADFGVNHDGLGNLRGYAYGANIGWINFETNGAAKVDLTTGNFSGAIYSANCGWISLSNTFAQVQTDSIQPGVPTLTIAPATPGLATISWTPAIPGFVLQETLNIATGWTNSVSGATNPIVVPLNFPARFYRLNKS